MTTPIFDQAHPKIIELTFSFLDLGQHGKNLFIPLINSWDTANFRVLWPDWPHPFLNMFSQKKFWSTFNLCEFVSTCKKTCYFIDLLRRSGWLKNPSILLAENILAHISWTKLSPNMGFVQELFSIFFNFLHFSINLSFWTIFGAKKFYCIASWIHFGHLICLKTNYNQKIKQLKFFLALIKTWFKWLVYPKVI